jgi:hypothetical protein
MPTELQWHQHVARELERRVRSRDWLLWLSVEPPDADDEHTPSLDELASEVEQWLASLDPDEAVVFRHEPTWTWTPSKGTGKVRLAALAKKPEARGSEALIGNAVPAFAQWTGR